MGAPEEGQGHPPRRSPRPWIDPADTRRMISANDGGVDVSVDGGESWSSPRLPIGQCYHVDADNSQPYRVSCALQDLGTGSGPSNSLSSDGINFGDWYDVGGGEAGHTAADPSDPNIVYAGEYLGIITRPPGRDRRARSALRSTTSPAAGRRTVPIPGRRPSWSRPTTRRSSITAPTCSSAPPTAGRAGRPSAPTSPPTTSRSRSGRVVRSRGTTRGSSITARSSRSRSRPSRRASSGWAATTVSSTSPATGAHLDERHRQHPRHSRLRDGGPHRGVAFRRRHRLRGRGRAPPRRHAPVPVQDDGLREDVEEPLRGAGLGRVPARSARRPEAARPPLRWHRARRDAVARRRCDLGTAESELPHRGRPRSAGEGQRPGGRDPRPVVLDSRQPDADPRDVAGETKALHLASP